MFYLIKFEKIDINKFIEWKCNKIFESMQQYVGNNQNYKGINEATKIGKPITAIILNSMHSPNQDFEKFINNFEK